MIPALIAAGTQIAGGLLNRSENKKAQKFAAQQAEQQYQQQKEFAQSGIQWKVQDAEKAGIHPLYALGANTISYSPQSVGSSPTDWNFLSDAGQNIGRAIDSTRSNPEKAVAQKVTQLQIEGLSLDNEFKRTQIASAQATAAQAGNPPGLPSMFTVPAVDGMPGQGNAPQVEYSSKKAPGMAGIPSAEAGVSPEVALYKTRNGYAPQIPQNLSESMEQDWPGFYQWMIRNKLKADPNILRGMPSRHGYRKSYNALRGEYGYDPYPTFKRRRFNRESWFGGW